MVVLAPQYLGSVEYYAAMATADVAVIDMDMRFDKRVKSVHRTVIAGNRGPIQLTVPIRHPKGTDIDRPLRWSDILVSDHNHWWTEHAAALESAYGRCPYFEHYYPDIHALLTDRWVDRPVTELDCALDAVIRRQTGIQTRLSVTIPAGAEGYTDLRRANVAELYPTAPYRQIRQESMGFIAHMSVLDRLFNLGPNA